MCRGSGCGQNKREQGQQLDQQREQGEGDAKAASVDNGTIRLAGVEKDYPKMEDDDGEEKMNLGGCSENPFKF